MEKDKVYQLLKHITGTLCESKMYFVVPAFNDSTVAFEIIWEKGNHLPWSFSLYRADNWTECSMLDIIDALEEIECDLVEFQDQVIDKALSQAAYMDLCLKETRKLLGNDLVDASIDAHEEFGKKLVETVSNVLNIKNKSNLTLVKD